eukprot:1157258-Pelagomonas_calceolata.AAC.3
MYLGAAAAAAAAVAEAAVAAAVAAGVQGGLRGRAVACGGGAGAGGGGALAGEGPAGTAAGWRGGCLTGAGLAPRRGWLKKSGRSCTPGDTPHHAHLESRYADTFFHARVSALACVAWNIGWTPSVPGEGRLQV